MCFGTIRALRKAGLLGLNRRNAQYTLVHNPRRQYPLVDDKLRTKRLAVEAGLAVPALLGVVETEVQIRRHLHVFLESHDDFVIKPSRGSGGNGILIVAGRSKQLYRKIGGDLLETAALGYHVSNILSGMYSLGGQPDRAMIEERVHFDPVFETVLYQGVPDIRIIVFLGVPVMAMVRLPTRLSGGRANLHQGAIGAGIDMAAGTTLAGVWRNEIISEHPDTGNRIDGIAVPGWPKLLEMAARCHELTGLGYLGVDLVLDRDRGPLILELNARPGLAIQLANRAGLRFRLDMVEKAAPRLGGIGTRVGFARERFSVTP
ncbi:MAG: alpha-L-glutamate ligase-like protein [Desulfobacterales bacterium]|nr:alpha-L-glutamate ligase-like protein [Desulfobacterales bacterium]